MPNEKNEPQLIPIEKIHDLPGVPMVSTSDSAHGGLVSSILLNGVKEPVILRQREDGEYQLVSGYRRRRASELARLKDIPAYVYDMTLKEAQEYRTKSRDDKDTPIPGKLMESSGKEQKTAAEQGKDGKAEQAPPTETAPADKVKKPAADKATQPAAPAVDGEKATTEDKAGKAEQAQPTEVEKPTEDKAGQPAAPATEEKKAPAAPEAKAPEKKAAKADKGKKPAAKPKEEEPTGTTAAGPTGTVITKILGEHLDPPTAADKKALPVPGEGEAFSAVLHPAYLKKADINTFSVDRESDDFKELRKSIERFGIKDPVLARFGKDGELEILSGQRRHLIASEMNYPVPAIIQQLDDDDARILVADGNLHREHITTYDLSRAVKMKSEAMKRKAGRRSKSDTGPKRQFTDAILAQEMGMSESKLNRLMKLSEATKSVCDLVDEGTLALSIAYNIAFLTPKQQETVVDLIGINVKVNNENTQLLKKVAEKEKLTDEKIRGVLEGTYPPKEVVKAPAEPTPTAPASPSMAPTNIPASPDVQAPATPAAETPDNIVHLNPTAEAQPTVTAPPVPPVPPVMAGEEKKEPVDRENSYETKIVLRGDRLRKYFPDVNMTPREIKDSVYDALEERRQRQERAKAKTDIFKGNKAPVK